MMPYLNHLSDEDIEVLFEAPVLVGILVAGADNHIDSDERNEMVKLARLRKSTAEPILQNYYEVLDETFEERMNALLRTSGDDVESRKSFVYTRLSRLNEILPKIEREFAVAYYDSLKSFGRNIAKASGGFLGYGSISAEEKDLMDLEMISDPSHYPA